MLKRTSSLTSLSLTGGRRILRRERMDAFEKLRSKVTGKFDCDIQKGLGAVETQAI